MRNSATALLFSWLVSAGWACAPGPGERPSGPPPLGPADLADPKIDRSSFSGSHSILNTGGREVGLGTLSWRQFSDWQPGGALFGPVLALKEDGLGKKAVRDYVWRPDFVRFSADYDGGLRTTTTCGYLGVDALFAQIDLENAGPAPVRLTWAGSASRHAHTTIAAAGPGRLAIGLEARPPNLWGAPPTPLVRPFDLRASQGEARVTGQRSYELSVDLAAGARARLDLSFSDGVDPDAVTRFWADRGRVPGAATRAVADWLAEAPVPAGAHADPRVRRMAYNAWFQFWYNTQHPEGLWKAAIITPSKSSYGRGIWLWDSAFHVLALVRGGPAAVKLGEEQVLALVRSAHKDGHLPREVWVGVANPEIQAPGVLTWAAIEAYRRNGNRALLEETYPVFAANDNWFYARRDANGNGLAEWTCADSGWDTSPRWDAGKQGNRFVDVDAVDLNCWLKLDQEMLGEMAEILGRADEAAGWRAKAQETAKRIRALMWDEGDGFFYDLNPLADAAKIRVKTPHTYWTLMADVATPEQAARMVPYLSDPKVFGAAWPMPCVSVSDPEFKPKDYWRGPVWVNLNWLTIRGLERYGYRAEAARLRRRTIELILNDPTPREYYNPLDGGGLGAHNYMWTGALFLVMLGEEG